jgi:hypothetical protein
MGMNKSDMANWFCFEIIPKKKTPCLLEKTSQHFEKAKEQKRRLSFFTLTVHWKT